MALTGTFLRQVKHSGAAAGDKYADGQALYLLVNASGKYWRMNYHFAGKQKTLAMGARRCKVVSPEEIKFIEMPLPGGLDRHRSSKGSSDRENDDK